MATKDDLIIQRLDDLKEANNERLDKIDANLADHMAQTKLVKQLTIDNQVRIDKLEAPGKALLLLKAAVLYISAIAGAILLIIKLWGESWK